MLLFIDDINMPMLEKYGAQPPIELLRQVIDYKGFYDRKKLFWKGVQETQLIAACGPPGGGRMEVTPRLLRHFNMIWMTALPQETMHRILSSILGGWLGVKKPALQELASDIVAASVEMFFRIISDLLPTPLKCHYTFNLRDPAKMLQGMLMVNVRTELSDDDSLIRLWVHETCRQFRDRLVNKEDRTWFNDCLHDNLEKHLQRTWPIERHQIQGRIVVIDFIGGAPSVLLKFLRSQCKLWAHEQGILSLSKLERHGEWRLSLTKRPFWMSRPFDAKCSQAKLANHFGGNHLEQAVLFPGGLQRLGLECSLPSRLTSALASSKDVLNLLAHLGDGLDDFQGNLEGVDLQTRLQQDVLRMAEDQQLLGMTEAQRLAREWWQADDQAFENNTTLPKTELETAVVHRASLRRKAVAAAALEAATGCAVHLPYICELRETRRSFERDEALADILRWTAMSGRDDGIFVGGEFSGKGLHVDQRPESNLGKQWRGLMLGKEEALRRLASGVRRPGGARELLWRDLLSAFVGQALRGVEEVHAAVPPSTWRYLSVQRLDAAHSALHRRFSQCDQLRWLANVASWAHRAVLEHSLELQRTLARCWPQLEGGAPDCLEGGTEAQPGGLTACRAVFLAPGGCTTLEQRWLLSRAHRC
ncbi:DNAH6 [Symbiodinium sp. CCMP2592]|nr:DNAH6 [Symbiodinium sp. CCMP2592]